MPLSVGAHAPDFTLPSSQGGTLSLNKDLKGQWVALFFYPKNFTSVCTAEACQFRDVYQDLKAKGVQVVGISHDGLESHGKFKAKYNIPYPLLSDVQGIVSKAYQARIPILGIPGRVTYLLRPDHTIALVIDNLFSAQTHIETLVAFMETKAVSR